MNYIRWIHQEHIKTTQELFEAICIMFGADPAKYNYSKDPKNIVELVFFLW